MSLTLGDAIVNFMIQLIVRLAAMTVVFAVFANTMLFQVGMIDILLRDFAALMFTMVTGFFIFLFKAVLRVMYVDLVVRTGAAEEDLWLNDGLFYIFFMMHNFLSPFFYVAAIDATFRLGDHKYYSVEGLQGLTKRYHK